MNHVFKHFKKAWGELVEEGGEGSVGEDGDVPEEIVRPLNPTDHVGLCRKSSLEVPSMAMAVASF